YNIPRETIRESVKVFIEFRNSSDNKLGMPLPAGTVRLYKKDDSGGQQFLGEDNIRHTPADEEVSLKVGEVFDVVADRKQMDYKIISSKVVEYAYEITLR